MKLVFLSYKIHICCCCKRQLRRQKLCSRTGSRVDFVKGSINTIEKKPTKKSLEQYFHPHYYNVQQCIDAKFRLPKFRDENSTDCVYIMSCSYWLSGWDVFDFELVELFVCIEGIIKYAYFVFPLIHTSSPHIGLVK